MREIAGKTAVITGAASGIGRALAHALAERRCALALADIHEDRLAEAAAELDGTTRVTTHVVDVRDAARVAALVDEVKAQHGGAQILVNSAGVTAWGTVEEMSLEDIRWVLEIDLWGVVHGCKLFLPLLRAQPEAHIVNVSSAFGYLAVRRQAAYCAAKYAVRGFTEALAAELDGTRIGVTCAHPGGVATRFITDSRTFDEGARSKFAELVAEHSQPPEKVARAIVRAIERGKTRVRVGPDALIFDWAKRLAPVRGQRTLARFLAKAMP